MRREVIISGKALGAEVTEGRPFESIDGTVSNEGSNVTAPFREKNLEVCMR